MARAGINLVNISTPRLSEEQSSWSYTEQEVILKFRHEWTIKDVSLLCQGNSIQSCKLKKVVSEDGGEIEWCLHFDPFTSYGDISVFFCLISAPSKDTEIDMKLKFSIIDRDNQQVNEMTKIETLCVNDQQGFAVFISIDELLDDERRFLHDDKLVLLFEGKGRLREGKMRNISGVGNSACRVVLYQPTLTEGLMDLFNKNIMCDVTLSVADKEIQAHKIILAAQSPVFRAMFEHDTKENQQNRVCITDMDFDVLEEMLLFMYTGRTPLKIESMAADLLPVANKYALERLKIMCVEVLYKNVCIDNVIEVLVLADFYNAIELKTKVIRFIKANALEVMRTDGWNSMLQTHHQLVTEICRALVTVAL